MVEFVDNSTSLTSPTRTSGTIRGFSLLGVPVRLHFTFILLVIFLLVTDLGSRQSSANYAVFLRGIVWLACCCMRWRMPLWPRVSACGPRRS